MKKIFVAGLSALVAGSGVYAQSLEERVEALEYQSYENFLKVSGSLEMRFDSVSRENNEKYTVISDPTAYGTALGTVAATAASPAEAGAFFGANCGDTVTTTGAGTPSTGLNTVKGGCQDIDKGTDNSRYARLFLNLDVESNPTNKLSFYGRLSMAKYTSLLSSTGSPPNDAAFGDLAAGAVADNASIWIERAFANYSITENLTFTFGRLPTIDGAPQHHHKNLPMAGNYPILAYSGIFDGVALTQNFGKHTARVVYTPFSTVNFDDNIGPINDADGDKIDRQSDTYAFMYEYNSSELSWARNAHVIAMYNLVPNLPIFGTNLTAGIQKTALYAEAVGVAGSNFDVAIHGMTSSVDSEGTLIGLQGKGGWLTSKEDDTITGSAYGILGKYNFHQGFMKNSALGVEYFKGEKGAFLYDTANLDPVSMYTTYGNAYRVFYTKDFDGGLKWNLQYMNQQPDYTYAYRNLFGDELEIDQTVEFVSTSFIAYF